MKVIEGGVELLEHIWTLWKELNQVHLQKSEHFKERYEKYTVEMREEGILERYHHNNIRCFLLQNPAGIYVAYCLAVIESEKKGKIESIYVKEDLRGKGLGKNLLQEGLRWLDHQGIVDISLEVVYGNDDVLDFYKRCGFYPKYYVLEQKIEVI